VRYTVPTAIHSIKIKNLTLLYRVEVFLIYALFTCIKLINANVVADDNLQRRNIKLIYAR